MSLIDDVVSGYKAALREIYGNLIQTLVDALNTAAFGVLYDESKHGEQATKQAIEFNKLVGSSYTRATDDRVVVAEALEMATMIHSCGFNKEDVIEMCRQYSRDEPINLIKEQ